MTIWNSSPNLDLLNERGALCANGHLGIEMLEAGENHLKARMPVVGFPR